MQMQPALAAIRESGATDRDEGGVGVRIEHCVSSTAAWFVSVRLRSRIARKHAPATHALVMEP